MGNVKSDNSIEYMAQSNPNMKIVVDPKLQ